LYLSVKEFQHLPVELLVAHRLVVEVLVVELPEPVAALHRIYIEELLPHQLVLVLVPLRQEQLLALQLALLPLPHVFHIHRPPPSRHPFS